METNPSLPTPGTRQTVEEPAISFAGMQSIWNRVICCNPFYLFSALLLLYGVYRASVDPVFLSTERLQVIFNYGSLQVYGLMLAGTVTLLARRRIFYDATLLYFIENVLVLVPFILISHAVFLDAGLARVLALIGLTLVVGKFALFKTLFAGLNLPRRLLLVGALIAIVNTAIPLVFRKGLETDNELWNLRSQYCWFLLLPLLVMAGHVLNPLSARHGRAEEEHRKQWLPIATLLLWIAGTSAHLYSIGYVDDQKFDLARFSVLSWAIAWLLRAKITLRLSSFTPAAPVMMLVLPMTAPLLALGRPEISITLHMLNAAIFAGLCVRWSTIRIPAILGGISLLLALFSVPNEWISPIIRGYDKTGLGFSLGAAWLIGYAIRRRTARWALIGGFVTMILLLGLGLNLRFSPHYALQMGSIFVMVHSLFWKGPQERGSIILVLGAAAMLVIDSYAISRLDATAPKFLPYVAAAPLLGLAAFRRAGLATIAASASMLVIPLSQVASFTQSAPVGMLAVAGSFALFAVGTGYAIWRGRFSDHATGTKETSI